MNTESERPRVLGAPKNWPDIFINELAKTSNVKAAALAASVNQSCVYKKRRDDPLFARRLFEALAEGYDNLEMDLLWRLRTGQLEDTDPDGTKRKFDISASFRCLIAHRDNVAREKGRKTLVDEVATIQSINAKIDVLRAKEWRAAELDAKRKARAADGS